MGTPEKVPFLIAMLIPGLQTKGCFALHNTIAPDHILTGRIWLRDAHLLGQKITLVESDGEQNYTVQLPSELPFPADNVRLTRVTL